MKEQSTFVLKREVVAQLDELRVRAFQAGLVAELPSKRGGVALAVELALARLAELEGLPKLQEVKG